MFADLRDSQPATQLIRCDEHAVYGDKACASQGCATDRPTPASTTA